MSKVVKNKYSQLEKKEVCDKHRKLVRLIYVIGFEKILQQQVIEIALMFRFYQDERGVKSAIQELEKYQIIKKIIMTINNNKFLVLCKYGRAYVRDLEDSQKVAAFDSDMTQSNQFDRIARVQLFINHVRLKNYQRFKDINSFNTYLVREDLTHNFYSRLIKTNHAQLSQQNLMILFNKSRSEHNFKKSTLDEAHETKQKQKFNINTDIVTMRQLIQKKIYLENIYQTKTELIFKFELADANNRYSARKFKENIIYIEKFVDFITKKGYGMRKIVIQADYICTDQDKLNAIKSEMNSRVWDNEKARYVGKSKLEALDPLVILETTNVELKVDFKLLESNYFKSN